MTSSLLLIGQKRPMYSVTEDKSLPMRFMSTDTSSVRLCDEAFGPLARTTGNGASRPGTRPEAYSACCSKWVLYADRKAKPVLERPKVR